MDYKKIEDFKSPQEAVDFINGLIDELKGAKDAQAEAEAVAEKALAKANDAIANSPNSYIADISGVGKVKVNFAINGHTKDSLVEDHDTIKDLLAKKSAAVTVVEEAEEK